MAKNKQGGFGSFFFISFIWAMLELIIIWGKFEISEEAIVLDLPVLMAGPFLAGSGIYWIAKDPKRGAGYGLLLLSVVILAFLFLFYRVWR